MSDDLDLVKAGTHAVAGLGGGTLVGALMKWVSGREAQEVATRLAVIDEMLKGIKEDLGEHKKVFEDVVEAKLALKALHGRMDDVAKRVERLESKRR